MSEFERPQRLTRSITPNLSSITWNPVQTQSLLGVLGMLGTTANSAVPRMGFDHPTPELPRIGRAAITGNKLRSQSRTASGGRHEIGFDQRTNVALTMDYSDAMIKLPWSLRDQWNRAVGAIGIDQILSKVAAEAVANTEEAEFVATCWKNGVWTTQYLTGTVPKWTNFASDPVSQVNTAKRAVQKACSRKPNSMIIPAALADALCIHPKMRSYQRGGQGAPVDQALEYSDLARIFKIEKLTVAERIQNNGTDLLEASISLDFSITDGCLLFVDDGNGPTTASAMVRAGYNPIGTAQGQGVAIDSGTDQKNRYDWWNILRQAGYNVLDPNAAAWFEDLI